MNKMKNQDQISAKLAGLKKENPFRAPSGYFDDFPARMQHRLELEKAGEEKQKIRFITMVKPILGLAAAFAAVFIMVYWPVSTINNRQTAKMESAPAEHSVANDLISLFEHIDEHTFYALLEKETDSYLPENDQLVAYLADNFSDYDVFLETQSHN
jgi:hypothetical protein